ncbi:MAG: SDR family NAD(P)-dependent oxidoreductase [Chloroflexota bacterium]
MQTQDELKGKVALVTGGAGGLGRAAALRLAANGAALALADVDRAGLQDVRAEITQLGGRAEALVADVSQPAEAEAMVEQSVAAFGQIDVLVHVAGVRGRCKVQDMSDQEWRRVLTINLDGTFYVCRAAARAMLARQTGTIILMTSDRGQQGQAGGAHYAASKGGMIAFMKSLAWDLGRQGITVNAINPGTTNTPFIAYMEEERRQQRAGQDPLGRLSQPDEIAETILFLASRGGKYMTGQVITTRMR